LLLPKLCPKLRTVKLPSSVAPNSRSIGDRTFASSLSIVMSGSAFT
jgi:hypothetical protein